MASDPTAVRVTGRRARVAVVGYTGRLGSAVCSTLERSGHAVVGRVDSTSSDLRDTPDVVIDASHESALDVTLALGAEHGAALVYCVSAVPDENRRRLEGFARTAPVVLATNLSLGHWLQVEVTRTLARLLADRPGVAASVHERHPRTKRDAPSASATDLASRWHAASGRAVTEVTSRRSGGPVSGHTLEIDLPGESVTVHHEVDDLSSAAQGAVELAGWLLDQDAGLHDAHTAIDLALRRARP